MLDPKKLWETLKNFGYSFCIPFSFLYYSGEQDRGESNILNQYVKIIKSSFPKIVSKKAISP